MKPIFENNRYKISYRVPGYNNPFTERFDTIEEANFRIAQIELDKSKGTLKPPVRERKKLNNATITLGTYLDEFVRDYGAKNWGDSYYHNATHRINNYIKPYLGDIPLSEITTKMLDDFYADLINKPAVVLKGHQDTGKTVSIEVVEKVRTVLSTAFAQAARWGYIDHNPAYGAHIPKVKRNVRQVWTPQQAFSALRLCDDPNLKMSILLALSCSMRIGEILGLQWRDVHITDQSIKENTSFISIKQELKRCDKAALKVLAANKRSDLFFTFPENKKNCKTSLVLKHPKTESSIRTVYLGANIAQAILDFKEIQDVHKKQMGFRYKDYNMVIAQVDGKPTEERFIAKAMKEFCVKNDLPVVVFHSLRALSTSMKLKISHGDIKSVQGDTGHATADMVTNVYARTFDDDRRMLASEMDNELFKSGNSETSNFDALKQIASNPQLMNFIVALAKAM